MLERLRHAHPEEKCYLKAVKKPANPLEETANLAEKMEKLALEKTANTPQEQHGQGR